MISIYKIWFQKYSAVQNISLFEYFEYFNINAILNILSGFYQLFDHESVYKIMSVHQII